MKLAQKLVHAAAADQVGSCADSNAAAFRETSRASELVQGLRTNRAGVPLTMRGGTEREHERRERR
eukprot:6214115-Pleurochrysis_carterae.AAC.3